MNRSLDEQVKDLAVVCLRTANFDLTLRDVCEGKRTVIDFWTAKCTRCPDALDKLNALAMKEPDVQFISVCCGKQLDAAREILEASTEGRWSVISHYFMEFETKEEAKRLLGFKQVPFYVVLDESGQIVYRSGQYNQEAFLPQVPKALSSSCSSPTNVLVIDDLDF